MRESFHDLTQALQSIEAEDDAFGAVQGLLKMVRDTQGPNGARVIFIGNGGSAAIASHMAADFQKAGEMPTLLFNDPSSLTAISNDIDYGAVFTLPMQVHARWGDVLFAISSSGESRNILDAARYAKEAHVNVVTLSGFEPNNMLRSIGDVNFYVPSKYYGTVETAHLAILHSVLDEATAAQMSRTAMKYLRDLAR